MKITGIYMILCIVSGNAYAGSARNVKARWGVHKYELRRGIHHCRALQLSWVKHGEGRFKFVVLEICQPDDLLRREQSWLNTRKFVYNSSQTVNSPSLLNREAAREHMLRLNQLPWTDERRLAASQRMKQRIAPETSVETRLKQSISAKMRKKREKEAGVPGPWVLRRLKQVVYQGEVM